MTGTVLRLMELADRAAGSQRTGHMRQPAHHSKPRPAPTKARTRPPPQQTVGAAEQAEPSPLHQIPRRTQTRQRSDKAKQDLAPTTVPLHVGPQNNKSFYPRCIDPTPRLRNRTKPLTDPARHTGVISVDQNRFHRRSTRCAPRRCRYGARDQD
jgi:hypothetical protein